MNTCMKRVIALILMLALSLSLCCPAFAAKEMNGAGLTFSASLNKGEVEAGGQPQTVTLTVKANKKFATDGMGLLVDTGNLTILSIANSQFQANENIWNASVDSGIVTSATSDAENVTVDIIAEVTIQIPANCKAGTYLVGIKGIEITKDYGTLVENNAEAYATLVITNESSPVDPTPEPEPPVEDPSHDNCPSAKFTDVNQDLWYHEGIDYVIENGLMNGVGGTLFSPNGTTTRGMLMTILARLDGVDTNGGSPWYAKGMEWAMENGISDGTNPTGNITREQMATMLYRYAGHKGFDVSAEAALNFVDAGSVSSYAVDAMEWAVAEGLINGVEGNALAPQKTATRAQMATILMRFCENVAN